MPHRLSDDVEEERRILHVGITRGRQRVLVLGDRSRRSRRSSASSTARADAATCAPRSRPPPRPAAGAPEGAARAHHAARPRSASSVQVLGGYEGTIEAIDDTGVRLRARRRRLVLRPLRRAGHRTTARRSRWPGRRRRWRRRPASALRAWRLERIQGRRRAGLRRAERQAPRRHRRAPPHLAGRAAGLPRHRPRQARVLRRRDPRGPRQPARTAIRVRQADRHAALSARRTGRARPTSTGPIADDDVEVGPVAPADLAVWWSRKRRHTSTQRLARAFGRRELVVVELGQPQRGVDDLVDSASKEP